MQFTRQDLEGQSYSGDVYHVYYEFLIASELVTSSEHDYWFTEESEADEFVDVNYEEELMEKVCKQHPEGQRVRGAVIIKEKRHWLFGELFEKAEGSHCYCYDR